MREDRGVSYMEAGLFLIGSRLDEGNFSKWDISLLEKRKKKASELIEEDGCNGLTRHNHSHSFHPHTPSPPHKSHTHCSLGLYIFARILLSHYLRLSQPEFHSRHMESLRTDRRGFEMQEEHVGRSGREDCGPRKDGCRL